MNTLIIAEKPSVAQSIASALGATKRNDGYFEGNGYFVSFAFGHLYTLADTKDYDPDMSSWDLKYYPFIPSVFKYKSVNDSGVKKQIRILKDLVKQSDTIINACDGDREGELIFAELKHDLDIKKPIKRLWITSHTPKDIEKGMSNLKSNMLNLESAGYCRQQVDWIIGINLTVVYTLKTGGSFTLKVGRVLLPTLKLIFDREAEIANFQSKPFYTLKAIFDKNQESYVGTYQDQEGNSKLPSMDVLNRIQEQIKGRSGNVVKKVSKETKQSPSKLFSLTDLQGHITSKYNGFSSDTVLDVMQSLYEKKHLTYPRTASRYLDDSQVADAKESLNAIMSIRDLNLKRPEEVVFHSSKTIFDSSKVDSHPAIIPTYIVPNLRSLNDKEKIVYIEVAKRFLSHFLPLATYDTLEIETVVNDHHFITKGKVLIDEGWKQLYASEQANESDDQDDQDDPITAKNIHEGDSVITKGLEIKEGKTTPPAHYNEKTLLSAMENCGKSVENEDDVLKGFTIGTPATRADTIKKLIDTGYIYLKGKNILITDLGAKVIHHFPIKRLLKVDFTGQIERTLKDIENGNYDPNEFMEKMTSFIKKNVSDMIASEIPVIKKPMNVIGKCPSCSKDVVENSKAFSCQGTTSGECKFTLWKDDKFFAHFGKRMTETLARSLVNNGKATVKGLHSQKKENTQFDAVVLLKKNQETGYWNYELEFDTTQKKNSGSSSSKSVKSGSKGK